MTYSPPPPGPRPPAFMYVPNPLDHPGIIGATGGNPGYSAFATADRAYFVPFTAPVDCQLGGMVVGNNSGSPGNYDIGVYDADFNLLVSLGSTAMTPAAIDTWLLPFTADELYLRGGRLYYAAVAFSNAACQIYGIGSGDAYVQNVCGVLYEASALPLPSTATPTRATPTVGCPLIALLLGGMGLTQ